MKGSAKLSSFTLAVLALMLISVDVAYGGEPDYPTKPITCYIPYGAGGSADLSARALMEVATKYTGQKFIPINRAGAGGALAAMAVANSKPDGYTLGVIPTSAAFMAPFSEDNPYRDLSGFTMIMNFSHYIYLMGVKGDAPWKTWQEFIQWAKRNPGAAKIAITGTKSNSSTGMFLWQLEKKEQVEFNDIPLKSSLEILTAFLGGHITVYFSTIDASTMQYIKEGKLRILLYAGGPKAPGYENVPTAQELYGFSIPNVLGIMGPKGLPDHVLKKLDVMLEKAVKDPEFGDAMKKMNMPVVYQNRAEMNAYVEKTFREMAQIFKDLKAEEGKRK